MGSSMADHALPDVLRSHGYRVTPQRVLVREILQRSAGHLSAQQVHAAVQARLPGVELSTIYRVLELFVRLGLVARSDLGEGRAVYEWCPEHSAHYHLVCERCGGVAHVDSARIAAVIAEECATVDFAPRDVDLTIAGTCRACRRAPPGRTALASTSPGGTREEAHG